MIRRLFSLVWAVAGRSKKIQDLVAMVWARPEAPVAPSPMTKVEAFVAPVSAPVAPVVVEAPAVLAEVAPLVAEVAPLVAEEVVAVAAEVAPIVADVAHVAAQDVAPVAPVVTKRKSKTGPFPVAAATPPQEAPAAGSPDLRPLGSKEAMDGSVWVPRILWALEFAKLRDLGPQSASDISRVLGEHSGLTVPSPNVARAFRDRKQAGASYWKEVDEQRYEISRAGSAALRKQLRSSDN